MNTTSPQPRTTPATLAQQAAFGSRRAVGLVIAATVSLLSLGLTGSAFAMTVAPGGGAAAGSVLATPTVRVINVGLATWQVALIAAGAALFGAAVALLAGRLRPAHRPVTAPVA
ncbi:MAG TPA: hypothetical protein VGI00_15485 [Streptosporangiaceae bacterium]|jgi:hypothetical protein